MSNALGAGSIRYATRSTSAGVVASNPAQALAISFSNAAVSIGSGSTRLDLSVRGVGFGSSLHAIAPVAPRARGNRVSYVHPGLDESYVNGPFGLEQVFTLATAPAPRASGPLTVLLALSGNARASIDAGAQTVTFARAGRAVLRYAGLSVSDAGGRVLRSWLALDGTHVLLRVDATGARYPVRIDPFIQQAALTGGEEQGKSAFGANVALSADGNTALIGGSGDNAGAGAAWFFTRSGSTWSQQGPKISSFGGATVALSADGNTALIGAPAESGSAGAVSVYTRSGATWSQQGEPLTGGGASGAAHFGSDVALSADGNTALVGGEFDSEDGGAAWVFTRSGSTWSQQGSKLTGGGEVGAGRFGGALALSSDGNTALIGARFDGEDLGAAWVFTRSGSTWSQQGPKLTGAGEVGKPNFGTNVSLSSDGNTALIGGPLDNSFFGAAWVFVRSGESWLQQGAKLTGHPETQEDEFGASVAVSGDGNTALVGGFEGAWAFARSGAAWTPERRLNVPPSGFFLIVKLSADANTALVGTFANTVYAGGAWVFVRETPPEGGTAEFGQCLSIDPVTGKRYRGTKWSAGCFEEARARPRGRYEWLAGPPVACVHAKNAFYRTSTCLGQREPASDPDGKFERLACFGAGNGCAAFTISTGAVTLETPGLIPSSVRCSAGTGSGEITGAKAGSERITLTGCEAAGQPCASEGPNSTPSGKSGVIDTNLLALRLASPSVFEIWVALTSAEHAPYLFEFACAGLSFRATGSLSGQPTPINQMASTDAASSEGEQSLFTELSEDGGTNWSGPVASVIAFVASNTFAVPVEVRKVGI